MIAKYCRFYGVTDSYVMSMPVKRFFLLYRQIKRLQAEETLVLLRVISQPYIDPKELSSDRFVDRLREDAGLEPIQRAVDLNAPHDIKAWGIGISQEEPASDDKAEKGFVFKRKNS